LILDKSEAESLGEEERSIYLNVFEKYGLSPVDFLHLIQKAERYELSAGESVTTQGTKNNHVYIPVHGQFKVIRDSQEIQYRVGPFQYIGEMSFFNWKDSIDHPELHRQSQVDQSPNDLNLKTNKEIPKTLSKDDGSMSHATVICVEDSTMYGWSFQDLYQLMITDRRLGLAVSRSLSSNLFQKMKEKWTDEPRLKYRVALSTALVDGQVSGHFLVMFVSSLPIY